MSQEAATEMGRGNGLSSNPSSSVSCDSIGSQQPQVPINVVPSCPPDEQFEDAPEDSSTTRSPVASSPKTTNPLEALAMACAAEEEHVASAKEGASTAAGQITRNDVLCGRGGLTNHHSGNIFFRRLVRINQEAYLRATKRDKAGVAREIVNTIRKLSPMGRFLKKDPKNSGNWIEIGDRKAREKTSQALREGAPELREELEGQAVAAAAALQQHTAPYSHAQQRARVVTDDSFHPLQQPQLVPSEVPCYSGTKRKLVDINGATCANQDVLDEGSSAKKGGPRVRLIKARMQHVN